MGLRPSARRSNPLRPSLPNSRGSTATARSGTFSHPQVSNGGRFGKRQTLNRWCGLHDARLFAVDRQTHRDGRAYPDAALDIDLAAMKLDEPLHDRKPKSRSIVWPVVGRARLEEGIADMPQLVLADTDAVILDAQHPVCVIYVGSD